MVGYCVSKCAALSFTNGIRIELEKWGIKVVSIEPHLFNTNLVAREAQRNALVKLWQDSKSITKYDYGEQFFDGALKLLDRGTDSARDNIPDVVQAMYDSVTLQYPERNRKICSSELERFRVWFMINILPPFLQDFLLSFGATFLTGKPDLLKEDSSSFDKSIEKLVEISKTERETHLASEKKLKKYQVEFDSQSETNNNNNNNNNTNSNIVIASNDTSKLSPMLSKLRRCVRSS